MSIAHFWPRIARNSSEIHEQKQCHHTALTRAKGQYKICFDSADRRHAREAPGRQNNAGDPDAAGVGDHPQSGAADQSGARHVGDRGQPAAAPRARAGVVWAMSAPADAQTNVDATPPANASPAITGNALGDRGTTAQAPRQTADAVVETMYQVRLEKLTSMRGPTRNARWWAGARGRRHRRWRLHSLHARRICRRARPLGSRRAFRMASRSPRTSAGRSVARPAPTPRPLEARAE